MRLFVVLSVIACSYAAKLDRTYLPPPGAAISGGSPGSISAPFAGSSVPQSAEGSSFNKGVSGQTPSLGGSYNQGPSKNVFSGSAQGAFSQGQSGSSSAQGSFSQGPSVNYNQAPAQPSSYNKGPSQAASAGISNQPAVSYGSPSSQASSNQGFKQSPTSYSQGPVAKQTGYNQPASYNQGPTSYNQAASNQVSSSSAPSGGFVSSGPQGNQYQGSAQGNFQDNSIQTGFAAQEQKPERPQAESDRNAEILRYTNENDGETFAYSFETSNGIAAEESGVATNGVQAQGAFSYTGDDGQFYSIQYTADENGYRPTGDHLPTPPPIPEEILKSIETNAAAAAAGTQEGAYQPELDNADNQQYNAPSGQGYQPANQANQATQNSGYAGQGSQQYNAPSPAASASSTNSYTAPVQSSGPYKAPTAPQFGAQTTGSSGPQGGSSGSYKASNAPQFSTQNSGLTAQSTYSAPASSGSQGSPSGPYKASTPQFNAPSNQNASPSGPTGSFKAAFSPASSGGYNAPAKSAAFNTQGSAPQFGQAAATGYNAPKPFAQNAPTQGSGNSGYQYNRPNQAQDANRPSAQVQPASNTQLPSFGRPQSATPQYSAPSSNAGSSQAQINQQPQAQASKPSKPQSAPYQYNPPSQASAQKPQPFNPVASQTFNQGSAQGARPQGFQNNQAAQGNQGYSQSAKPQGFSPAGNQAASGNPAQGSQAQPSGQAGFPAARQPPSFSEQDGYKY